jgi:transposase
MLRFSAEGPDGLRDRKAPGPKRRLTEAHRQALAARSERGPIPALHGVVRWRLCDLGQWLCEEFAALRPLPAARVSVSKQTLSRTLRAMGYRTLPARPKHHARAAGAIEACRNLPATPAGIAREHGIGPDAVGTRSPTRPAQAGRTGSLAARHGVAPAPRRHRISAMPPPVSPVRSARARGKARPSFCPSATPPR